MDAPHLALLILKLSLTQVDTGLSCIVMPDAHVASGHKLMPAQNWAILCHNDAWCTALSHTEPYRCLIHSIKPYWYLMHITEPWMQNVEPYRRMMHCHIVAWCTTMSYNCCLMHSLSHTDAWCTSEPWMEPWCTGVSHTFDAWCHTSEPYWYMKQIFEWNWAILVPDAQHWATYWCLIALSHGCTALGCNYWHMMQRYWAIWHLMHSIEPYWAIIDAWCRIKLLMTDEQHWAMIIDAWCHDIEPYDAWCTALSHIDALLMPHSIEPYAQHWAILMPYWCHIDAAALTA